MGAPAASQSARSVPLLVPAINRSALSNDSCYVCYNMYVRMRWNKGGLVGGGNEIMKNKNIAWPLEIFIFLKSARRETHFDVQFDVWPVVG